MSNNTHTGNEELRKKVENILYAVRGYTDCDGMDRVEAINKLVTLIQTAPTPQAAIQGDDPFSEENIRLARRHAEQLSESPTPTKSSGELEEMRMEIEKRVHIAMIHARNTKDASSLPSMLKDTVQIIAEALAAQTTKLQAEARLDELVTAAPHFCDKPTNFVYYKKRIAQLEREHKIGEDGE